MVAAIRFDLREKMGFCRLSPGNNPAVARCLHRLTAQTPVIRAFHGFASPGFSTAFSTVVENLGNKPKEVLIGKPSERMSDPRL
jgi:hypothetical protein